MILFCSSLFFFLAILYSITFFFFFFNDTATTEIYTLSLHDALPICLLEALILGLYGRKGMNALARAITSNSDARSEEHTSELQSQSNLVCRLLLEKKKKKKTRKHIHKALATSSNSNIREMMTIYSSA